jgi:hypothetical protein
VTTPQLIEYHTKMCNAARQLMAQKNHDYAGKAGDTPFANFMVVENLKVTSAERGILVRLCDKLQRLIQYIENGEFKVKSESFEDTGLDAINYTILLLALIKQQQTQELSPAAQMIAILDRQAQEDAIATYVKDYESRTNK